MFIRTIVDVEYPLSDSRIEEIIQKRKEGFKQAIENVKKTKIPPDLKEKVLASIPRQEAEAITAIKNRYKYHPVQRLYGEICFWFESLSDPKNARNSLEHCEDCQETKPNVCDGCQTAEDGEKYQLRCLKYAKELMEKQEIAKAIRILIDMNKDGRAPDLVDFLFEYDSHWADLKITHKIIIEEE